MSTMSIRKKIVIPDIVKGMGKGTRNITADNFLQVADSKK